MRSLLNRIAFAAPVLLLMGLASGLGSACGGGSESPITSGGNTKSDGGGSDGGGSGSDADGGGSGDTDGGSSGGQDSGSSSGGAPTWTAIYTTYFAAGTAGHCGNSGCHLSTLKGFKCGSDKTTCYNGFVTAKYITTASPASSPLADPNKSCLTWLGGNMPPGGASSNAAAAKDLTAWANAGALNN